MDRERYNNLVTLLAGYLHQDWVLEYDSAEAALTAFADENTKELINTVVVEGKELLNDPLFVSEPNRALLFLSCYYDPSYHDRTAEQWLKEVIAFLETRIAG